MAADNKFPLLVVVVDETAREVPRFDSLVRGMQQRFGLRVMMAFKEPELLFLNKKMLRCAAGGTLDRVIVSDEAAHVWLDAAQVAKRSGCGRAYFATYRSLIGAHLDFLRFLVSFWFVHEEIEYSPCGRYLGLSSSCLEHTPATCFEGLEDMYWRALANGDSRAPLAQARTAGQRSSLFVTTNGVSRLGGVEAFKRLPLRVGGSPTGAFTRVWSVDNDLSLDEFLKQDQELLRTSSFVRIPGLLGGTGDDCMMVDINPAAEVRSSGRDARLMDVPRQILSLRVTPQPAHCDKEAVFVMSNFNKELYIAGSLYSVLMQTHPKCSVAFMDDVSTDDSVDIAKTFKGLIDSQAFDFQLSVNQRSRGTYWIRNSVIHRKISSGGFYLINDSDDFSSCQRAVVQLSVQTKRGEAPLFNIGDIVRVDNRCATLLLDGKGERYGSASLCAPIALHREVGYYENIRKNGDTEFIERVKHFKGKSAMRWLRYPVLFQTFDGNNLTADIYQLSGERKAISSDLSIRQRHRELFESGFRSRKGSLAERYPFPASELPPSYRKELPGFLIEDDATPALAIE